MSQKLFLELLQKGKKEKWMNSDSNFNFRDVFMFDIFDMPT